MQHIFSFKCRQMQVLWTSSKVWWHLNDRINDWFICGWRRLSESVICSHARSKKEAWSQWKRTVKQYCLRQSCNCWFAARKYRKQNIETNIFINEYFNRKIFLNSVSALKIYDLNTFKWTTLSCSKWNSKSEYNILNSVHELKRFIDLMLSLEYIISSKCADKR